MMGDISMKKLLLIVLLIGSCIVQASDQPGKYGKPKTATKKQRLVMPGSMAARKQEREQERAARLVPMQQQPSETMQTMRQPTWAERLRGYMPSIPTGPTGTKSTRGRMPTTLAEAQEAMQIRRKPARYETGAIVEPEAYYSPGVQEFLGRTERVQPITTTATPEKPSLWQKLKQQWRPTISTAVKQQQPTTYPEVRMQMEPIVGTRYPQPGTPEYEERLKNVSNALDEANKVYVRLIEEEARQPKEQILAEGEFTRQVRGITPPRLPIPKPEIYEPKIYEPTEKPLPPVYTRAPRTLTAPEEEALTAEQYKPVSPEVYEGFQKERLGAYEKLPEGYKPTEYTRTPRILTAPEEEALSAAYGAGAYIPTLPEVYKGLRAERLGAYQSYEEAQKQAAREAREALKEEYYKQYGISADELKELKKIPLMVESIQKAPISPISKWQQIKNMGNDIWQYGKEKWNTLSAPAKKQWNRLSYWLTQKRPTEENINALADAIQGFIQSWTPGLSTPKRSWEWLGAQYGKAKEYAGKKLKERAKRIGIINEEKRKEKEERKQQETLGQEESTDEGLSPEEQAYWKMQERKADLANEVREEQRAERERLRRLKASSKHAAEE